MSILSTEQILKKKQESIPVGKRCICRRGGEVSSQGVCVCVCVCACVPACTEADTPPPVDRILNTRL